MRLAGRTTDSATRPAELAGASGTLLLGAASNEPGRVRIEAKGRVQDFIAITEDETPLATGARVTVLGADGEGRLMVTRLVE